MKELTIEQKAQRYDEAIERAKKIHKYSSDPAEIKRIEQIFPELIKEIEDERVRKWLIMDIKQSLDDNVYNDESIDSAKEALAWLEKQGEHTNFRNKIQIGDKVTRNEDGVLVNLSQLNRVAKKDEKQGEQKPVDKVEPKFKVGDWVIFDNGNVERITSVGTHGYTFDDGDYLLHDDCDKNAHLWTIQDAKDGDVLAVEPIESCYLPFIAIYKEGGLDFFNSHCFIGFDGIFYNGDTGHSIDNIHPATKEQRNTLMKAMADAGYTFDFEKKELKKNEQKSAWSEEDERLFQIVIDILDRQNHLGNISRTDLIACVRKLKSLKPQNRWKPSDEQIKALDAILVYNPPCSNECRNHLITLYNDLKKLKE